jgi:beta-galactosidase, putative
LPLPDIPVSKPAPKFESELIPVEMFLSFDEIVDKLLDQKVFNPSPLTFEQLSVQNGFILYSTKIDFKPTDPALLTIKGLNDRAIVIVDRVSVQSQLTLTFTN